MVQTLNRMRDVWDPDEQWPTYHFERQAQTFADVRLIAKHDDGAHDETSQHIKAIFRR